MKQSLFAFRNISGRVIAQVFNNALLSTVHVKRGERSFVRRWDEDEFREVEPATEMPSDIVLDD